MGKTNVKLPGLVLVVGAQMCQNPVWAVFACWTYGQCVATIAEFQSMGMNTRCVIFSRAELLGRIGGAELLAMCEEHCDEYAYFHMVWGYEPSLRPVFGPAMRRILADAVLS